MKTNYLTNKLGWSGIILILTCLLFTSCKKEENKQMAPINNTTSLGSNNPICGMYVYAGTNHTEIRDTVNVFYINDHYYMNSPWHASFGDTININVQDSTIIEIPNQQVQPPYTPTIEGSGIRTLVTKLTLDFTAVGYVEHNVVYYKQ